MIDHLAVIGSTGAPRRFGPGDAPVMIGGSARCGLRLPGMRADDEAALLGFADGRVFLQARPGELQVMHNGKPVTGSVWVADGDRIGIGAVSIDCRSTGTVMELRLDESASGAASLAGATASGGEDERIYPHDFGTLPTKTTPGSGPWQPLRWLVGAVFVVLAALAWYTFTARSVELRAEPAGARLEIQGALLPFRIGGRFLLRPGQYAVNAQHPGYYPLQQTIAVGTAAEQFFDLRLRKLPGLVSVDAGGVPGAGMVVGNAAAVVLPVQDMEIPAGTDVVEIRAPRHLPFRTSLNVRGMRQRQSLSVVLVPDWAAVSVSSEPAGAILSVDGEPVGETPVVVELSSGPHQLLLSLANHDDWRGTTTVLPDQPQQMPVVALQKTRARVMIRSRPEGATVQVDGVYRGRTPVGLWLDADQNHQIVLTHSGYRRLGHSATYKPGEQAELELEMVAVLGRLRIDADPADAELLVDGRSRGTASRELQLSAVPHRIEIRKPGYVSHRVTVTPRPGLEQAITVRLEPESGSTVAAGSSASKRPPGTLRNSQGQELVRVEPARFTMGSSRREQGRRSNEVLREVEVTRAFLMGRREVTNGQFRRFDPQHSSGTAVGHSLDTDQQPVVRVSWDNAVRYCNWLSQRESLPPAYREEGNRMRAIRPLTRGYRLPTEAEWALAARNAGRAAPDRYPWSGSWPPGSGAGNYADRSAASTLAFTLPDYDDGYAVSAPVGQFPANVIGIQDLGGNVSEWVQDRYTIQRVQAGVERDPLGPVDGRHHVIRGSNWRDASISELRLSYRDYGDGKGEDLGFRVARYAD